MSGSNAPSNAGGSGSGSGYWNNPMGWGWGAGPSQATSPWGSSPSNALPWSTEREDASHSSVRANETAPRKVLAVEEFLPCAICGEKEEYLNLLSTCGHYPFCCNCIVQMSRAGSTNQAKCPVCKKYSTKTVLVRKAIQQND